MENLGWVKLWRKSIDSSIFKNEKLWRLFCYCLMRANHEGKRVMVGYQEVNLKPGEFIAGRFEIAKALNIPNKSARRPWRWLKILETMQILTIKSTNKFSIVSINNWHTYQGSEFGDDQQNDKPVTNERQTSDKPVTTNKNDKECTKNDKEEEREVPKKSNPQIKEFIDFAFQEMKAITGTALIIKKASEPPLVKRLLGTIKLERLKLLWIYFIEKEWEEDDWLEKMGRTLTSFSSRINSLNQNYDGWRQGQDYKAKYGKEM